MDGIRKYSREWFAANGTGNLDKIKTLENSVDTRYCGGTINGSIFLGSSEDAKKNVDEMVESSSGRGGKPSATVVIAKQYGVENLFNILDANSNGQVTEQEIADVAAVDTAELAKEDDKTLSVNDLNMLYENAMGAVDAALVENDNVTNIQYADGDKTSIREDNQGNVLSKYTEISSGNDGKKVGTDINYEERSITTTYFDQSNRPYKTTLDKDGSLEDSSNSIEYGSDGSKKITTDTVGRTTVIATDPKGKVISNTETYKYDSDGQIDDTKQRSIGDCWVLAGVNALSNSKIGRQVIDDSITTNSDGTVTVEFKGVNKSYTFTPEEIAEHEYTTPSKKYSSGDHDMNLLEMATTQHRRELLESGDYTVNGRRNLGKSAGDSATLEDPISGGQIDEVIYCLTGQSPEFSTAGYKKAKKMTEQFASDTDKYVMTVSFRKDDSEVKAGTITTGHAYNLTSVDKDYVYVVNPWDSSVEIPYKKEDFYKNAFQMSVTDLAPEPKKGFFEKLRMSW